MSGPENALVKDMQDEYAKWKYSTRLYGSLNSAFRIVLIVTSAIVAAEKNLVSSPIGALVGWVPVLALVVGILTALDSWLKPRDKWRGFMQDRDELRDLLNRAETGNLDNAATVENLRRALNNLRAQHRKKNVY